MYDTSLWLVERGLAVALLVQALNYWSYCLKLQGSNGLEPMKQEIKRLIHANATGEKKKGFAKTFFERPSILWFVQGDLLLRMLINTAIVSSVAVLFNYPAPLFLSLAGFCLYQIQAPFHWYSAGWHRLTPQSALLLGIVTTLFPDNPAVPVWAIRLFWMRIMVFSGLVKIFFRDPGWLYFLHMDYHYWTQDVPNIVSYYMNLLPHWVHVGEVFGTYLLEIVFPVLMFGPPWLRLVSIAGVNALMVTISTTGGFGWFPVITIAQSLSLVDAETINLITCNEWVGGFLRCANLSTASIPLTPAESNFLWAFAIALAYSGIQWCFECSKVSKLSDKIISYLTWLYLIPFLGRAHFYWHTVKRRYILVVEGRRGNGPWKEYEFPYTTGPVNKMPSPAWDISLACVIPNSKPPTWLFQLLNGLLTNAECSRALLAHDPFDGQGPTEVRVQLYDYHMVGQDMAKLWRFHVKFGGSPPTTPPPTYLKANTPGAYWNRELLGTIFGPTSTPIALEPEKPKAS